jgi:hypothetical protein
MVSLKALARHVGFVTWVLVYALMIVQGCVAQARVFSPWPGTSMSGMLPWEFVFLIHAILCKNVPNSIKTWKEQRYRVRLKHTRVCLIKNLPLTFYIGFKKPPNVYHVYSWS